ncbi:hypothetical protein UFOVP1288_36 [uncultured Caudovirales phage]|uniref:Uncharacterized protein n=1 Tax=uncultured Caudovirales phage TaxID=2100421 RepID=A0A6J5S8B3_9CAUD|nr:hypothetical protein UFOVP1195_36 [uncultured Caudovirales phage]CAB4195742.1 hypothetical protein UFOVP1288_36 [uncultured Caudovirales phage]CAB4204985.1 hypothetical protein UFOVP1409_36 [uncultured Caudovirales phage]
MGGSSSKTPQVQTVNTTTNNIPSYVAPYYEDIMQRAQGAANQDYLKYPDQRIADPTAAQTKAQQGIMGLIPSDQFTNANQYMNQAGMGALAASTQAPQQVTGPGGFERVSAMYQEAPQMTAAQTGYNPQLNSFQQQAPDIFGTAQAQQYMSPYAQNVMDVQKQQAIRDAQKSQLVGDLGAARQGTYGGARQLLAGTERERALQNTLSNIQATGQQASYENAQSQFERDRAAGLGVGAQNQQASLATQQLGTNTGLQTALANLSSDQQARVQNQASILQTQGLNATLALQAALANQSAGLKTSEMGMSAQQANQSAGLQGQQNALQGYQLAGQIGQGLGGLAAQQQTSNLGLLNAQYGVGSQQQQQSQAQLDQDYADFLRQQNYPQEQLSYYNSIVHGLPYAPNQTVTSYAPTPSLTSQIGGAGLTALSAAKLLA